MYEIFIPKSEILQKYIYNFYVVKEFSEPIQYLAFPQLGMTMALFINSQVSFDDTRISISPLENSPAKILLLGKYKLPIQLKYESSVPEISLNFTPTGLNYFFKENTDELAKNGAQFITEPNWLEGTKQIFEEKTNEYKIEKLEKFLLDNLFEKDITIVENYLALLTENPDLSQLDIAEKLEVSTKTIKRSFLKFVRCSAMDFKQILRFRKAVQTKFQKPSDNLTQICFESYFYDSPHFTREFKKLTHLSPKDFFSQIEPAAEKDIPYKFL